MATKAQVQQRYGEFHESPVALSQDICKQVCDFLTSDLCAEYVLFHQTKKHHWIVTGPSWHELHLLLDRHAKGQRKIADEIAERITYLGGVPVGGMAKMEELSFIKPEDEGVFDLRTCLQRDLEMNQAIIQRYRQQIERSQQLKDFASAYCLMRWLQHHETWAHELNNYLESDGLFRGNGRQ